MRLIIIRHSTVHVGQLAKQQVIVYTLQCTGLYFDKKHINNTEAKAFLLESSFISFVIDQMTFNGKKNQH